jgi:hypothetical protein
VIPFDPATTVEYAADWPSCSAVIHTQAVLIGQASLDVTYRPVVTAAAM